MFKAMIMLTRRSDMTHEEFATWWTYEHAPLARTLPEVRRIVFNVIEPSEDSPFDGVAELWFDSSEDFQAAYATEVGKAIAADSIAHLASRVRMFAKEYPILSD